MRQIVLKLSDKEVEIVRGIRMALPEQVSPNEEELCRQIIREVKRQCDQPVPSENIPFLRTPGKDFIKIVLKLSAWDIDEIRAARCVKSNHPVVNILLDEIIRQIKEGSKEVTTIEFNPKTIEEIKSLVNELESMSESRKDDCMDAYRYARTAREVINKHKEDTVEMCEDDLVEDIKENLECTNTMRPYVTMLTKKRTTCMVRGDVLKFQGTVFRNKKLLPYDGSSVKVLEYKDYIEVFTPESRLIVCLYKNHFRVCQRKKEDQI